MAQTSSSSDKIRTTFAGDDGLALCGPKFALPPDLALSALGFQELIPKLVCRSHPNLSGKWEY